MSTWKEVIDDIEAGVAREMAKNPGPPVGCECAALQTKHGVPVMCETCSKKLERMGWAVGPGV